MENITVPPTGIVPIKIDEKNQIYYFDASSSPADELSWDITCYAQRNIRGMKNMTHRCIETQHMFLTTRLNTLGKYETPTFVLFKSIEKLPPDEQAYAREYGLGVALLGRTFIIAHQYM